MKAKIEENGMLIVIAENSIEAFALTQWDLEKHCLMKDTVTYKEAICPKDCK